jgi:hypothetical protein
MGKNEETEEELRGSAPIGILEYWNVGILGFGLRLVEPTLRAGSGLGEVIVGMVYWENHIDKA